MIQANTENQKLFIDRYLEEGIKLDYWWMDAGWYPCNPDGWPKTGTWEVDTRRFPKGLREISDYAHAKGMKIIVWFEPERVHPGTWLAKNHPEWILGGKNGGLLNLGNPEAWNWLADHVDKLIDRPGHRPLSPGFQHGPAGASGEATTPRTAKASPRTSTSPVIWPIGTNCSAAIPRC